MYEIYAKYAGPIWGYIIIAVPLMVIVMALLEKIKAWKRPNR